MKKKNTPNSELRALLIVIMKEKKKNNVNSCFVTMSAAQTQKTMNSSKIFDCVHIKQRLWILWRNIYFIVENMKTEKWKRTKERKNNTKETRKILCMHEARCMAQ